MKKQWAALAVMLMCTGSVTAAPAFVDASGALTVQDRNVIDSIVRHYAAGTRPLAARMDDAEDAIEDYLDQQYGDDVYDVHTQFPPSGDDVRLIVQRRALKNAIEAYLKQQYGDGEYEVQTAAQHDVKVDPQQADGTVVVDLTGRLTATDLAAVESIVTKTAAHGGDADMMEDEIERYLDGQYGHDRYDADVKRHAKGYRVWIKAD